MHGGKEFSMEGLYLEVMSDYTNNTTLRSFLLFELDRYLQTDGRTDRRAGWMDGWMDGWMESFSLFFKACFGARTGYPDGC